MKIKALMLAICLSLVASVAYATTNVNSATFTANIVPQNTNTANVKHFFPFPLSRPALINSDILNTSGLNLALCTAMDCSGAGVEVPYMGGPATSTIEYYFVCDVSETACFSNFTTQAQSANTGDVNVFPAVPANGDAVYYGFDTQSRIIAVNLSTAGAGEWDLSWSYSSVTSTTSSWNALSGVDDNTNEYKSTGLNEITWDLPLDWVSSTVNGQTAFWVRSEVTSTSSVVTSPVGSQVFQEQGFFTAIATTTAQNFSKNSEKTLFMYAGGDTDFVDKYQLITSRISTADDSDLDIDGNSWFISWTGYYGNDSIPNIIDKGDSITVDWDCSGGACGPTVNIDTDPGAGDECDVSAQDSAWTNKVVKVDVYVLTSSPSTCFLQVDEVAVDNDGAGTNLDETADDLALQFDGLAYLEEFVYAVSDVSNTAEIHWKLDNDVFSSTSQYVSASPQLQNLGTCGDCDATFEYVFQNGFSGRAESFEPVFSPDALERSGSLEIVPILPTTTFATLTTPNQNLPGGDALHHALTANLGLPTTWGWGAVMLGIVSMFIIGAAILTRGNFLVVLIAGGIPIWISTAPQVDIWPIWIAATYTAVAIIGYIVIKGNVIKI